MAIIKKFNMHGTMEFMLSSKELGEGNEKNKSL